VIIRKFQKPISFQTTTIVQMQKKRISFIAGILLVLATVAVAQNKEYRANSVHLKDSAFTLKPELDKTEFLYDEMDLQINPEINNKSGNSLNATPAFLSSPEINKEMATFSNTNEQSVLPNLGITHQYKTSSV